MADNQRYSGPSKGATADSKKTGSSVSPGPWEAIVQGHPEGSRMGQLIVTIPELGGTLENPTAGRNSNQLTVSYASPFYGTTFGSNQGTNPDGAITSGQSYGMWCVPPDIGNKVLVMFVAGDTERGYWFACVYDGPNHHMVPGISRNIGGGENTKPTGIGAFDEIIKSDTNAPVSEYNISSEGAFTADGLINTPRYVHPGAMSSYVRQGLDRDKVRGAISSSSMREAPSNVYGISTPGRKATPTDQVPGNSDAVFFRNAGHTFVMDDGDKDGTDQLIRLRTSGGHQILMNDTEQVLYIGSASGSQWLEFSPNGAINVFAGGGFNMRSSGPINMHSDTNITMCAPHIKIDAIPNINSVAGPNKLAAAAGIIPSISINSVGTLSTSSQMATSVKANGLVNISAYGAVSVAAGGLLKMSAVGAASISAGAAMSLGAVGVMAIDGSVLSLNCAKATPPTPPVPQLPPIPNKLPDTSVVGKQWISGATKVDSTCAIVPTHEPWDRTAMGNGKLQMAAGIAQMAANSGGYSAAASLF
jgi:hypothetical protein